MEKKKKTRKKQARRSKNMPKAPTSDKPIHPWRVCPYGEHQVVEHPKENRPSKVHPDGSTSTVHWHCASNPSGKDQLYPPEIREIAAQHFSNLKIKPCSHSLGFPKNGSKFDDLIAGWVQYWNEVLQPNQPLEPNLVKALIASESGFESKKVNSKGRDRARGLMQVTNATRKLLDDENELTDHYLTVTKGDLSDPAVNICVGIRWLFRKRQIASVVRLKRQATWLEAAEEYKGDLEGLRKGNKKVQKDVAPFQKYLKEVEKCGK
jgi:hypothetical protein